MAQRRSRAPVPHLPRHWCSI